MRTSSSVIFVRCRLTGGGAPGAAAAFRRFSPSSTHFERTFSRAAGTEIPSSTATRSPMSVNDSDSSAM